MKLTRVIFLFALITVVMGATPRQLASHMSKAGAPRTKVVLLGTGTPVPDPDRSGPATAIVVDDSTYWSISGRG